MTVTPTMQMSNTSLLAKVTQSPLLISTDAEQLFLQTMNDLSANESFAKAMDISAQASLAHDEDDFWDDDWARPYNVQNGILVIPISGVLLNRFTFQFGRWATGYQYIERAFNRGQEDPEVNGIALAIDSPGGEVAGNFELVDKMYAMRGNKPVIAYATDHAYSAAYSIASVADEVVLSRSGGVGSVGVVTAHVEFSEALKEMGVKVTFIFAGKHKVEGNPYEKLPEGAKARIQAKIDRIYGEFTGLVARNRDMDEQAVRDTEALTFDASDALDVNFADRVGAMEEELVIFSQEAEPESELMATTPKKTTPAAENDGGQITQAQMDAAVAEARAEGHAEGVAAEQERMNAIMGSDEGKARPVAAQAALEAGMDADAAVTMLGKLPEEKAAAPETPAAETPAPAAPAAAAPAATPFAAAMGGDNPEVGAEAAPSTPEGAEADQSNVMLNALASAQGRKRKQAS